jgi:hypothetical protein
MTLLQTLILLGGEVNQGTPLRQLAESPLYPDSRQAPISVRVYCETSLGDDIVALTAETLVVHPLEGPPEIISFAAMAAKYTQIRGLTFQ